MQNLQSTYKLIPETKIFNKKITISWNSPEIKIQKAQKPIGKYKKVGKQTKYKLHSLVEDGISIIKASSLLKINYSTAKSILQNLKKHSQGKESTSPSDQESNHHPDQIRVI